MTPAPRCELSPDKDTCSREGSVCCRTGGRGRLPRSPPYPHLMKLLGDGG